MLHILFALLLTLLCCYLILIIRSFEYMSARELKRQARKGNLQAAKVYSVRGVYGLELWIFLWALFGLMASAVVLLLNSVLWVWVALIFAVILFILASAILPWLKKPRPGLKMAASVSFVLEKILHFIHPPLSFASRFLGRFVDADPFADVKSKDELLEILLHTHPSDQISREEIRIASSALVFGDKTIGEVMVPLGSVKQVSADTILSPVELGELHDSGFSRFPVMTEPGHYVGTMYLKDAVEIKDNKYVKDAMRKDVYYVNEAASLDQALKAFLKTKHHLFMVVNEFEDVVGIITIEDILEQVIGAKIVDEFDQYDDLRSVALSKAKELRESREQTVVE